MRPKAKILTALACATLLYSVPAVADEAPAFRDFTFKKVKPPKRGSQKRITIQVTPEDMARQRGKSSSLVTAEEATAVPETSKPAAAASGAYNWFWTKVAAKLEAKSPGRLSPALAALGNGPGGASVPSPRLDVLQKIVETRGLDILKATVGTEVSPALVLAVIAIESGGRAGAASEAGAVGLMQLMPATAERFGVSDREDAAQNIKGGVAFLDFLMKEFDRDPVFVLASYNAGENAVRRAGGVPDYAETRDYVPKVLAAYQTARGLCMTPPQLLSDGCVFNFKMARAD